MHTFIEHVQYVRLFNQLQFLETFFPLDSEAYDALFETELEKLAGKIEYAAVKSELEELRGFRWTAYIAASVRNSGINDQRELDERTHEIVSKMLLGGLFSNYDPTRHGPLGRRFRASVGNAVRNQIQKVRNRRRHIPSIPIMNEPGGVSAGEIAGRSVPRDESLIDGFRELVADRLGELGLAVFDLRLNGEETKSLVGSMEYGEPTSYRIKQTVIAIKRLAQEFAQQQDDDDFLREIEKALAGERETVGKRFGKAISSGSQKG